MRVSYQHSRKEIQENHLSSDKQPSMELADGRRDVVDPEVRAYVSSLVTAVSLPNYLL